MTRSLRETIRSLYVGQSRRSRRFRIGLLIFDLITLAFFVIAASLDNTPIVIAVQLLIAALISLDLAARFWICPNARRFLVEPATLIDIAIVLSLLAPLAFDNLAFLRVLRAVGLFRSFRVLEDLKKVYPFFTAHERVIQSGVNLFVFIFVVSSIVYLAQHRINPSIDTFMDALYFTVATLTTTGFGDITLVGDWGHLLAVIIMVVGIGLFLRLLQTIFQPDKVNVKCKQCGLKLHDMDASHCKHCGSIIYIETKGGASSSR